MPTPPTSRGAKTQRAIIHAAHDLFIRKGYHGTSMRTIAAEAGVALGGIYNHFRSKEDIFRHVLLTFHPYTEILSPLSRSTFQSFEEFIRQAGRMIDDVLSQRPDLLNLMFIEIVEFDSAHIPELLSRVLPQVAKITPRIRQNRAGLRPIPVPMILRSFIGMVLGYFLTKNALGEDTPPEYREKALQHFTDIYLHGILSPETTP